MVKEKKNHLPRSKGETVSFCVQSDGYKGCRLLYKC